MYNWLKLPYLLLLINKTFCNLPQPLGPKVAWATMDCGAYFLLCTVWSTYSGVYTYLGMFTPRLIIKAIPGGVYLFSYQPKVYSPHDSAGLTGWCPSLLTPHHSAAVITGEKNQSSPFLRDLLIEKKNQSFRSFFQLIHLHYTKHVGLSLR